VTAGVIVGAGKQHILARTGDGRVHLVYADPAREHLYHLWSNNDGTSWQMAPPLLVATSDLVEAALASGLTNTLHLAYGPWVSSQYCGATK